MFPKFPSGPPNPHILSSQGPSKDNLRFYSTTYSNIYRDDNRTMADRKPLSLMRHKGTGYVANFRPAIYYSSKQDAVDNPPMRQLLRDIYDTNTKRDYIRHPAPNPNEPLPTHVISGLSGFGQNFHHTLPTQREVNEVHMDTRLSSSLPAYPRPVPLLHTLQNHDPIPRENARHGPKSMTSEAQANFDRKPLHDGNAKKSCHSQKEDTGHTQAINNEPLTFRPPDNHSGELPGYVTWRPTGRSIMKKDFFETPYMKGYEPLENLSHRADLSNGFVKGNCTDGRVQPKAAEMVGYTFASQLHPTTRDRVKQKDPAEHSILTRPQPYSTLTGHHYQGIQRSPLSEDRKLGRECLGHKELTGFTENNLPLVEPRGEERDGARFSTHYQNRFADPTLKGVARQGYLSTGGSVQPPGVDAYAKSTQVHKLGSPVDTMRELRTMHPYTARSLVKRYPYQHDDTYSHKTKPMIVGTL